ncbi:MAG: porin family protein [Ferruginibacter sp.]
MKKIFSLIAFTIISGSSLFAQSFHIGLKAGTDIHKIDGKSFKDEFTFGYHAGAFAQIGITPTFGIQPEVMLSQVNADTSSSFSTVYQFDNISKIQLKYLQIPILLNFNPNKFVSLQAGPQFSVLMDQNKNALKNGQAAFKSGDFSMVGGLQLNISKIRIYGRYVVGLSNINDIDNQEKWKNQTVSLGVGFAL